MQYQGKLTNQIWENSEKPNFRPAPGPIGPNLGPTSFLSYHRMQFQGKCMIQIQENDEKPHFGPDLSPFRQNFSYHHLQ